MQTANSHQIANIDPEYNLKIQWLYMEICQAIKPLIGNVHWFDLKREKKMLYRYIVSIKTRLKHMLIEFLMRLTLHSAYQDAIDVRIKYCEVHEK